MKGALVCTSIGDGEFIRDYIENFECYDSIDDVEIIVIPDLKTREELYNTFWEVRKGFTGIFCPDATEQMSIARNFGLQDFFPWNTNHRRNLGYLLALEHGVDFIISIDDDNFPIKKVDFFREHRRCLGMPDESDIDLWNEWFNPMKLVGYGDLYPRGYPYYMRGRDHGRMSYVTGPIGGVEVHVNAGLWTNEPDFDALRWMDNPTERFGFRDIRYSAIVHGWTPLNTQNTSVRREAITAWYYPKMNGTIKGCPIGRFDDILSGYFLQACMRSLGGVVRFGTPLVEHRRNAHDYIRDAMGEVTGIYLCEHLLPWLTELKLEGSTYPQAYEHLTEALIEWARTNSKILGDDGVEFLVQTAVDMDRWRIACGRVG